MELDASRFELSAKFDAATTVFDTILFDAHYLVKNNNINFTF